jgi:thioredoxin reductase (NADPH)
MLVHRRGELRATKYLREKLENAGVPVRWDSVIKEITGEKVVKSVIIYDRKRGVQEEISVEGIFVSIGEEPNNELAAQIGVKIDDENGYIITDKNQRTNVERVYAAGDVTGGVKQIVVACAKGAIAATSAYNDLLKLLL